MSGVGGVVVRRGNFFFPPLSKIIRWLRSGCLEYRPGWQLVTSFRLVRQTSRAAAVIFLSSPRPGFTFSLAVLARGQLVAPGRAMCEATSRSFPTITTPGHGPIKTDGMRRTRLATLRLVLSHLLIGPRRAIGKPPPTTHVGFETSVKI